MSKYIQKVERCSFLISTSMILTHLNSADEYIWNELLLVYYNLFAQWTYQFNMRQATCLKDEVLKFQ
jgi:hypothetical protein